MRKYVFPIEIPYFVLSSASIACSRSICLFVYLSSVITKFLIQPMSHDLNTKKKSLQSGTEIGNIEKLFKLPNSRNVTKASQLCTFENKIKKLVYDIVWPQGQG